MPFQPGTPQPVSTTTTGPVAAEAAQPVYVVSGGPVLPGPAQPVYVVTSGPVKGGPAIPVQAAASGGPIARGPAMPVFVVSGSLGGGAAAAELPLTISGLQLWLRASAITGLNDGDAVTTWIDESTNGRNATQSTAANKPLYKTNIINSLPVVRFDGTNDELRTAAFAYNQPCTIISVLKTASVKALAYWYASLAAFGCALNFQSGSTFAQMFAGSNGPGAASGTGNRILIAEYNGASSLLYVNNAAAIGPVNVGAQNGSGLVLGNRHDSALPIDCDIAEVLIYNSVLSSTNRVALRDYLNTKYAIF